MCPVAPLGQPRLACGGDDGRCFATRSKPYADLLSPSSGWRPNPPLQRSFRASPPLAQVAPLVVGTSLGDQQAAAALLVPRCTLPLCPANCSSPLAAALGVCSAFLAAGAAAAPQPCAASLAAAAAACSAACFNPVGAGLQRVLDGRAAAADAASAAAEAGRPYRTLASLAVSPPRVWNAARGPALAAAWARKLGAPAGAVRFTAPEAAPGAPTLVVALEVVADTAAAAAGIAAALRLTTPAAASRLLALAGAGVGATAAVGGNVTTESMQ